ncbi:hypothetical protein JCM5350_005677 [Sporobolomyces pararoseus]
MDDSSISDLIKPLPNLPPELIDEILDQECLSKSDLARCCLVSHQFLYSSRPALYSTLSFDMIEYHDYGTVFSYARAESTCLLLSTLRSSPALRIAHTLIFVSKGTCLDDSQLPELRATRQLTKEMALEFLRLLPSVHRLSFPDVLFSNFEMEGSIYLEGTRWSELNLRLALAGSELRASSTLTAIERLTCGVLAGNGMKVLYLPPSLKSLEIGTVGVDILSIGNASKSSLESLSLNATGLSKIYNIQHLPKLKRLRVVFKTAQSLPSRVPTFVNHLRSLSTLTLHLEHPASMIGVVPFLSQLPPSLTRLDLPRYAPLEELLDFINSGNSGRISTIGLWKHWQDASSGVVSMIVKIEEACERKDIRLVRIEHGW